MSKKKSGLVATSLRKAMISAIFIIILLAAVGFYFAQDWLGNYAAEADQTASGSSASASSPQALSKIREEIAKNQDASNKAASLVGSSQNYQNQSIKDLNKYASATGISIDGYNLTQSAMSSSNGAITITGLKANFITITLNNPVPIKNLLQFIKLIESNLPKMQLTGINLSPSAGSKDDVTVDPLTIEVFTK